MAKISACLLLALGFSGLVTLTLGKGYSDVLSGISNQLNPAKQCPTTCANQCDAEKALCVDVPGEAMSCEDAVAICNDECDIMCGCLANCDTSCKSTITCDGAAGAFNLRQIGCTMEQNACITACEAECPATTLMDGVSETIEKEVETVDNLVEGQSAPE